MPLVAMMPFRVQAKHSQTVKLRAKITMVNPNGRFRRGFSEWYPKDIETQYGTIRFYMVTSGCVHIENDSHVDHFFR